MLSNNVHQIIETIDYCKNANEFFDGENVALRNSQNESSVQQKQCTSSSQNLIIFVVDKCQKASLRFFIRAVDAREGTNRQRGTN